MLKCMEEDLNLQKEKLIASSVGRHPITQVQEDTLTLLEVSIVCTFTDLK